MNNLLELESIKGGALTGLMAVFSYLTWSVFPLPTVVNTLLHFFFGIMLIMAFIGIYQAFKTNSNYLITCAAIFGMFAGATFMMMTVVQHSNYQFIADAYNQSQDLDKKIWGRVWRGVDSVQLGLDVCWDIFITSATIFLGVVMLRYSKLVKIIGIVGILVSFSTLSLNLYYFPMPPSQSGSFDAGPLVGSWYFFVCLILFNIRKVRAMDFPKE